MLRELGPDPGHSASRPEQDFTVLPGGLAARLPTAHEGGARLFSSGNRGTYATGGGGGTASPQPGKPVQVNEEENGSW